MQPVTLDELSHYVWPFEPEWGAGVTARFRLETDSVASLTKRESRRAYSESLRVEIDASYLLRGSEAAAARNVLRILQDTPLRLPFPPGLDDASGDFASLWWMAFNEGGSNLYWTQDSADSQGREHMAPTLLGYLVDASQFQLLSTDLFSISLRWRESSDFAERLELAPQAWTPGPSIGARTIYQFPFIPDFAGSQDAGPVVVDVERQDLGFGRITESAAYPQLGSRNPTFTYTLSGSGDAATLLRFFLDRGATVEPFWLPCWVEECKLTADIAPGDAQVIVSNAAALGDHRYLMFYGDTQTTRKITAVNGNVLTLDSPLGVGVSSRNTLLCTLALVRFAGAELSLTWETSILATSQIKFTEVPQEYFTPLGENYGASLGPLPSKCYLFEVRHGQEIWRWTSYERDLVCNGVTYRSCGVAFDEIVDGLAWESTSCRLKFRRGPTPRSGSGAASGPVMTSSEETTDSETIMTDDTK